MSATPYTTVSIDALDRSAIDHKEIIHHDDTISLYIVDQPGYIVYLNGTIDDLRRWANDLVYRISKLPQPEPVTVGA